MIACGQNLSLAPLFFFLTFIVADRHSRAVPVDRETGLISDSIASRFIEYLDHILLLDVNTNNDCIITRIKSIILMCETHVKSYTKPCRTFNKITPRFKMKNTFVFNISSLKQ